jgi:diacylglycerol kinase family enzyme
VTGAARIRRAVLVVNPAARGAGRAEPRAVAAFAHAGVACEVRRTAHPGHAAELAAARDAVDAVFVLGGDGTAMEVVGALAGTGVPIGIVPGGTGNLVARMLGVPLDPARAVAVLLAAEAALIDLGRVSAAPVGLAPGGALGDSLGDSLGGPGTTRRARGATSPSPPAWGSTPT